MKSSIDSKIYTTKWELYINTKKTKNNIRNANTKAYTFGTQLTGILILNTVNEYSYLGIIFDRTSYFNRAQKVLYDKANWAYYNLLKKFSDFENIQKFF